MSRLSEDGKTVIVLPGTKKLRNCDYNRNTKIERVVCTKNMEEIGDYSFKYCTSLTSIELKSGLKRIGYCTFQRCTQLMHVSFVDGMEEIGDQSFLGCTSLTSIELKPGLKRIGHRTFYDCDQLTAIIVPFKDLPTSLRSSQVMTSAYQRLMGEVRSTGASELKNLIVSRPLTCPETVALDLSSTTDAYASELFKIREKEYNIAQSLHLVVLILRKQLRWSSFGKVGIPILRYWFRGTRSFPLDTQCFLSSKSASVCETAAAKDIEL